MKPGQKIFLVLFCLIAVAAAMISQSPVNGQGSNVTGAGQPPGGANSQVQYNSNGVFAGNANLAFTAPATLTVGLLASQQGTLTIITGGGASVSLNGLGPNGGLNVTGPVAATGYQSATNCSSSASPAVCGSAASGSVVVAAAATTVQVNTTAVTANSQVQLTFDSSLGTKLSVTCNTTAVQPTVSARTGGTSFTITIPSAPTTNPACFSYTVVN